MPVAVKSPTNFRIKMEGVSTDEQLMDNQDPKSTPPRPSAPPAPPQNSARPSQLAAYADLFMRLADIALLVHADTLIVLDANDAAERILGVKADHLIGAPLMNWVVPEHREEFEKNLRIARRRYYPREMDMNWVFPDGRVPAIRVSACPLKLLDGREVIQVIARDVTAQKEAEAKATKYVAELENLNRTLEALSTTDEKTQLPNLRSFRSFLEQAQMRSKRYGHPYSLVFFDLDHFKFYNDRNGHHAGDDLLKKMALILRESCRTTDYPCRFGGEEFIILCPDVDWQSSMVLAERIRRAVEEAIFPAGEHQPLGKVTVSAGVASFPAHGTSSEEVLQAANQALSLSKKSGRNRTLAAQALKKSAA